MSKQEAIEFFENELQCQDTDAMFLAINRRYMKAVMWALVALDEYQGDYEDYEEE